VDEAVVLFGEIDVIVTCAATIQVGPAEVMEKKDYEEAIRQIFWSAYVPTMAVVPRMRARKRGSIVHVTSFGGQVPAPHLLPYSTAKFAATGFSSGLRAELAKDGIRVTTIAPGLLRTGGHVNAPVKGDAEKELGWFGLGATLPFVSLASERAAEKIVAATANGDAEPIMSIAARLASIFVAAAPGTASWLLALQNSLLPSAVGAPTKKQERGQDVVARSSSPVVSAVDALGHENAVAHNEYPGPFRVGETSR
jgi:NAD(P)-dependent dehydrogenase (short-subunit alcohol dehydrogenase family)